MQRRPIKRARVVGRAMGVVVVFCAGFWLGGWLSGGTVIGGGREDEGGAKLAADGVEILQRDGESRRGRGLRQESGLGFSRKQWSMLVRKRLELMVPLHQILPGGREEVPLLEDIPIIAKLFEPRMPDGFGELLGFFGWDEERAAAVNELLREYGRELAEAEAGGAVLEYPVEGGIRVDFSGSRRGRELAAEAMKEGLTQLLGERDAARFALVSRLEGLAGPLSVGYEIRAEFEDGALRIEAPGVKEVVAMVAPGEQVDFWNFRDMGLDQRIRHLGFEIDWERLAPDGQTQAGGGR